MLHYLWFVSPSTRPLTSAHHSYFVGQPCTRAKWKRCNNRFLCHAVKRVTVLCRCSDDRSQLRTKPGQSSIQQRQTDGTCAPATKFNCDVWQVRYATGAIRNISVEEVGKRIVKAIPNVMQQLNLLSSSQDQVLSFGCVCCRSFASLCWFVFCSRMIPWLTCSCAGHGPLRCSSSQELVLSSGWLHTYTFYN
jgi:hypothetical protein